MVGPSETLASKAGERVGLHVEGVNAPGHFLAAVEADGRRMLVDPFGAGRVLTRDEAFARIARVSGRAAARGYAGPYADAELIRGVRLTFLGLRDAGDTKTAVDLSQRSRIGGVELSGLLGMDVLDGAVIVVDPSAQRVHAALPGRK